MQPQSPFVVDREYTRNDVYELLDVPKEQQKGNWETGYNPWGDDLYLFPTIGSAATGGFDYANAWDGDDLIWWAKNNTHLDQPLIKRMLNGDGRVFIFTREAVRQPFVFQGLGKVAHAEDSTTHEDKPAVKIRWTIDRDLRREPPVYVLLWGGPDKYAWDQATIDKFIAQTRAGTPFVNRWSTGSRNSFDPDGRVFLLRTGVDRGIVGSGSIAGEPFQAPTWDKTKPGGMANYVNCRFDALLPVKDRLTQDAISVAVPGYSWIHLQASGAMLPVDAAQKVLRLWEFHLANVGFADFALPDEPLGDPTYREGARQTVTVNRYERNREARDACIAHWKPICDVCSFDFGKFYGTIGDGYIHVHHLKDISMIGSEYQVDPVKHLRPVCPNCHAMLHQTLPAMSIDDLKAIIAAQAAVV